MENIKARILEAFKKYDLKAIREDWGVNVSGPEGTFKVDATKRCCGLGALLIDQTITKKEEYDDGDVETLLVEDHDEAISLLFNVSLLYVTGFTEGFDDKDLSEENGYSGKDRWWYEEGHQDGKDTWKILEENEMIWVPPEELLE